MQQEERKIIGIGNIDKEKAPLMKKVWLTNGLRYNLLSTSQLCDNVCKVEFQDDTGTILNKQNGKPIFTARREGNVYVLYLYELVANDVKCLTVYKEDGYLWHIIDSWKGYLLKIWWEVYQRWWENTTLWCLLIWKINQNVFQDKGTGLYFKIFWTYSYGSFQTYEYFNLEKKDALLLLLCFFKIHLGYFSV